MEANWINFFALILCGLIFFSGNLLCQYISGQKVNIHIDYFQSLNAAFAGISLAFVFTLIYEIEYVRVTAYYLVLILAGNTIASLLSGLINFLITRNAARLKNSIFILTGLFNTDLFESSFSNFPQLISRFTWELPQTIVGYIFAQTMNTAERVGEVRFIAGATYCLHFLKNNRRKGVSIGNFIHVSFLQRAIIFENDPLLLHEYGHHLQSRRWGILYLFVIGIPSLISAIRAKPLPAGITTHDLRWYEMQANRYAALYLKKNFDVDWAQFEPPFNSFPRSKFRNLT